MRALSLKGPLIWVRCGSNLEREVILSASTLPVKVMEDFQAKYSGGVKQGQTKCKVNAKLYEWASFTFCAVVAVFRNEVFASRYTLQITMAAVAVGGAILCMMSLVAAAIYGGRLLAASTGRDRTTG